MEENREFMDLLRQIRRSNRTQTIVCCILCVFALIAAVCCVLLFTKVYDMLPQLNVVFAQLETVLTNLETVTKELAQADIGSMVSNVDTLAQTSQSGIQQALEKINGIDIENLNKAIDNLSKIVTPLADLVQKLSNLSFLK